MKKAVHCIIAMAVALCLSWIQPAVVCAAKETALIQENYEAKPGRLIINAHKSGEEELLKKNLTVKLDGQPLLVEEISRFDMTVDPVTFYCLVDVSGSMDAARIETVKEMIRQLMEQMKAEDNMLVATIADEHHTTGYLSGQEELSAAVDEIARTSQDTNLYFAINDAVKSLQQNASVHTKSCLIIFSDGADEQATGITKDEVTAQIKESRIPVYTVAMLKASPNDAQLEAAKILGSFARASVGGVHYAPLLEAYEYDTVVGKILEECTDTYHITCILQNVTLSRSAVDLQTTWRLADETDYIDKRELAADSIRAFVQMYSAPERAAGDEEVTVEAAQDSQKGQEAQKGQQEQEPQQAQGQNALMLYMIVAAAVAAVILLIIMLGGKKKKQEEAKVQQEPYAPQAEEKKAEGERKQETVIRLTRLGAGTDEVYTLSLRPEGSLGRSRTCQCSIPQDKALSSLHCTFICRNQRVYLRDEHSSNGTYLNGVRVLVEHEIKQDDILFVGSYKYRVMW